MLTIEYLLLLDLDFKPVCNRVLYFYFLPSVISNMIVVLFSNIMKTDVEIFHFFFQNGSFLLFDHTVN